MVKTAMLLFSVIIPTANRYDKLLNVIESLEKQAFDHDKFEVIVVNDGSTELAYQNLYKLPDQFANLQLKILSQPSSGAAVARNLGLDYAEGKYVLFLGDDTNAHESLLNEHFKTHSLYSKVSVLGCVDWEPSLAKNSVMAFIAPYGPQFDYNIKKPLNCGYRHFYTSNLSVPKEVLGNNPFRIAFTGCCWEDIDLGYRLEKKGIPIVYQPKALVFHDHFHDESSFVRRQHNAGRNKKVFYKLNPELKSFKDTLFFLKLRLLFCLALKSIGKLSKNRNFYYYGLFEEAWIREFLKK